MMNVLLSNENFIMFAMKAYNNPRCYNISEFHDDLNHIKYLKRLLRRYKEKRTLTPLQLRLILNHLIIIFNVFDIDWAVRILFFKMEKQLWNVLKTFLVFLSFMPDKLTSITKKDIFSSDIKVDMYIARLLRLV